MWHRKVPVDLGFMDDLAPLTEKDSFLYQARLGRRTCCTGGTWMACYLLLGFGVLLSMEGTA